MDKNNRSEKLSEKERQKSEERSRISALVVHEAIRQEGEAELERASAALAWSGLAAGLSMVFSMVAVGLLKSHLPETQWAPLISKLGYSLGFLIVILGRQQLFTENTILVIIPLLMNPTMDCFKNVARLWAIVRATNLLGVLLFTMAIGYTEIFSPEAKKAFIELGETAMTYNFLSILLKGVVAGWLIALITWLMPMAETAKIPIIVILTYTIGLGELSHVIAGSAPILYLAVTGQITFIGYFLNFMIPTLIGNIIGGVAFAAAINHAQAVAGES
jgi:formate/nitrite transporter FocA (FNT family)